ncbi:MAG: ATPase, T2SS/T4P/T4SS family [Patescibacteria group bacterium]
MQLRVEPAQLKAFLLDSGLLQAADIEKAETEAKKTEQKIGDVLISKGLIKEDDLLRLQAYILGIPYINLEKEKIDVEILRIIPEPIARKHNIIAYKKNGKNLEIAMLDPEDLGTIDFIKKQSDLRIVPRLTSPASIKHALTQYQRSLEAEFGDIIRKESATVLSTTSDDEGKDREPGDLKKIAQDLPIIKIVDTLLRHAIFQKASDIHIEPLEKEVVVRYRIDGILRDAMILPRTVSTGIVARIKVLSNLKLDEHRLPQDGRFKAESEDYKVSFRVSILPVTEGEKVVIRLLPEGSKGFTLEKLGFHGKGLEDIHANIQRPTGMVLVTGPTGSGKTTTLYTILDILNTPDVNISTIEDPVEYRMPRVNQSQVHPDIGYSFANGLRSLLRQDPDIIMVGEIRDNETASLGINAALTGHLVFSTLHTNSAAGSLPRLIDMKVEPFLIASTIYVIVAQRLVRTLCREKTAAPLTKDEFTALEKEVDMNRIRAFLEEEGIIPKGAPWKDVKFYKPKETADCPDGYQGRMGIHETMLVNESIRQLIMQNATSDQIEKQAKSEGMMTMLEDGIFKAAQGITTIEEVLRVTRE